MNDLRQRFTDLGKIIIDPAVDACGKKRKSFEETAHVRIVAVFGVKQQPPRHLRILARKLPTHLAQIGQFALIVFQEFLAHRSTSPRTRP